MHRGGALFAAGGAAGEYQAGRVDEVEIQYTTDTGLETSPRLGTGDVGFLIKHLEQSPEASMAQPTLVPPVPIVPPSEPTRRMIESVAAARRTTGTPAMPMKFCRFCGAKIPEDSVYCQACGMKLA